MVLTIVATFPANGDTMYGGAGRIRRRITRAVIVTMMMMMMMMIDD